MSERPPVCLTCGKPTSADPLQNLLADGRPCPACRDRLLESLPAPLPRPFVEVVEEEEGPSEAPGYELPSDGWTADSSGLFDHLPGEPPDGPIGA
jgi:hypothetical protein